MKEILTLWLGAVLLASCATPKEDPAKQPYEQDDVTRIHWKDKKTGYEKTFVPEGGYVEVDPQTGKISFFQKGKDYPTTIGAYYKIDTK